MKSVLIVSFLIILVSLIYFKDKDDFKVETPQIEVSETKTALEETNLTAKFQIITNGTVRLFSDSRYHKLSPNVYIDPTDTSTIIVAKTGVTWSDFFKTLPMSLDKKCLITGTKQTFCTNNNQTLKFFINNTEDPNALDKVIEGNDFLLVEYR